MDTLPTITPVHDRVLVKRLPEDKTTVGGVYIPDTAQEKPQLAKVLAVGPGRTDNDGKLIPCGVSEGDVIVFGKYSYTDILIRGEEFLILRADEIWGIVKNYEVKGEA